MCATNVEFDWQGLSLPVPDGILYYLADVDPEIKWNALGMKSHEKDMDAANRLEEAVQKQERTLRTTEGQRRFNEFLTSALNIYKDLMTNRDAINHHFPDQQFVFVIGPMRTGGTYLLNECLSMLDLDSHDFHHQLVGDGMPSWKQSLFWNIPINFLSLVFEIAQYLQWVKERWPRDDYVVKKRTCLGHCLPLLDEIFGEKARYLVTVRHPGGIAESSEDYFRTFGQGTTRDEQGWDLFVGNRFGISSDDWQSMNHEKRVMHFWKSYYVDIGTSAHLDGQFTPVAFDRDSEDVVQRIADEWDVDHEPEAFTPSDRTFSDFWDSNDVEEAFDSVKSAWNIYDREWPDPPRL